MSRSVEKWSECLHASLLCLEAGEGEDGRMKSAIGIGALLMDGLGDTIRVSLTEDPEFEIDPCRKLAQLGEKAASQVGARNRCSDSLHVCRVL